MAQIIWSLCWFVLLFDCWLYTSYLVMIPRSLHWEHVCSASFLLVSSFAIFCCFPQSFLPPASHYSTHSQSSCIHLVINPSNIYFISCSLLCPVLHVLFLNSSSCFHSSYLCFAVFCHISLLFCQKSWSNSKPAPWVLCIPIYNHIYGEHIKTD